MLKQRSKFYTSEQLMAAKEGAIPKHIAIAMDGNRRWGTANQGDKNSGHSEGAKVVLNIVEGARDLGVKTLTLYTFSTENWNRPPLEIALVMSLIESYLKTQQTRMIEQGVCLGTIGDLSKLPSSLQDVITEVKKATAHCSDIHMVLAINYGARDELVRACQNLSQKVQKGIIQPEEITEKAISDQLDTHLWTDPDMLIRSGGEMRISNYLLWQLSYSELVFTDTYWPDFRPQHLYEAVLEFQKRERRRGA